MKTYLVTLKIAGIIQSTWHVHALSALDAIQGKSAMLKFAPNCEWVAELVES